MIIANFSAISLLSFDRKLIVCHVITNLNTSLSSRRNLITGVFPRSPNVKLNAHNRVLWRASSLTCNIQTSTDGFLHAHSKHTTRKGLEFPDHPRLIKNIYSFLFLCSFSFKTCEIFGLYLRKPIGLIF